MTDEPVTTRQLDYMLAPIVDGVKRIELKLEKYRDDLSDEKLKVRSVEEKIEILSTAAPKSTSLKEILIPTISAITAYALLHLTWK